LQGCCHNVSSHFDKSDRPQTETTKVSSDNAAEDLSFDTTVAVTKQTAEIRAGCKTVADQNWIVCSGGDSWRSVGDRFEYISARV
jgi:hypothetical protein